MTDQQASGVKFQLQFIPNKETKSARIEFNTGDMPRGAAEHLVSHLKDALDEFMTCVGATGVKTLVEKNTLTGEAKTLETETFGDETPIDPKKVN